MTNNSNKEENSKFKTFLKRKNIEISFQRYFIEALGLMAYGLFASLLVGTILNTLGKQLNISFLSETIWPIAQQMTGASIGVAVAFGLKAPPLVLFASTITGTAGNMLGGPAGAYCAAFLLFCWEFLFRERYWHFWEQMQVW